MPLPILGARDDSGLPSAGVALKTSLRLPLDGFVGRTTEMVAVARLVGESRLVTITGAPGMGESRLAEELAARLSGTFAEGLAGCPNLVPRVKTLVTMARVAKADHDLSRARRYYDRAAAVAREDGFKKVLAVALSERAELARLDGKTRAARATNRELVLRTAWLSNDQIIRAFLPPIADKTGEIP